VISESGFVAKYALRYCLNVVSEKKKCTEEIARILADLCPGFVKKIYEPVEEKLKRDLGEVERRLKEKGEISSLYLSRDDVKRRMPFRREYVEKVERYLKIELRKKKYQRIGLLEKRLNNLFSLFTFSSLERDILRLLVVLDLNEPCRDYFMGENGSEASKILNKMGTVLEMSPIRIRGALNSGGKLRTSGMISGSESKAYRRYSVDESIVEHLLDESSSCGHERLFKEQSLRGIHSIDSFDLKDEQLLICRSLLGRKEGCHLLLHGRAGRGKTSLAKSLIKDAGKQAFIIPSDSSEKSKGRTLALTAARGALDKKNSVIIVDEADNILNTDYSFIFSGEGKDKAWINQFLDEKRGHFIWITNKVDRIPESTLRRFDSNIELPRLQMEQKIRIWSKLTKKNKVRHLTSEHFRSLANKYDITPAMIQSTLNVVAPISRARNATPSYVIELIEHEIKTAKRIISVTQKQGACITKKYSTEFLNTSIPIRNIESLLRDFVSRRRSWSEVHGIRLLFEGVPGTGKTELAKRLANELEMPLIIKRASDILGCYVGETEKNIAMAFAEAESSDSILFLDEFDSFLRSRESADRSWEVTQVNELLTQMENFSGIFLASTNFVKNLDPACIRRFTFKIQFGYLTESAREKLYHSHFLRNPLGPITSAELLRLRSIPKLALGDFKTVSEKSLLLGARSHGSILDMLEEESRMKSLLDGKPIGIRPQ
jgi:transitional endoplasmic reticulum ATPase